MRARYLDAARARRLDEGRPFGRPPVILRTLGVEVAEDDLGACLLPNADALGDRIQVSERRIRRAQVPIVGVVDGAGVPCGHPVEFDDLFSFRVVSGEVKEAGRQPVCALVHTLPDEVAHPVQLLGGGRSVVHSHHVAPSGVVAHEEQRVHSDAIRGPSSEPSRDLAASTTIHAQHDRGDALVQKRTRITTVVRAQLRVGVHVNQPGRDRQSGDVDRVVCGYLRRCRVADERDSVPRDGHVRENRLGPGPVENGSSQQEKVVCLPRLDAG